jgi:hypothetical protein
MKVKGSLLKQEAELEASKDEIATFFDGVIPEFVRDGGGILSDTVKFWRFKNALRIVTNSKKLIVDSGLAKKEVPLKVLLPILENSTLEEVEQMQDKWSNLLANAITGAKDISPNYAEILKELSPLEVGLLDKIFEEIKDKTYEERKNVQFAKKKICEMFKLSSEQADLIIENLYRLNLFQAPAGHGIAVGEYKFALRTTEIFEFTTLGFKFVEACKFETLN